MEKKQFRTESQKLLDMMINSIYTHKEIFLRELISNASDAIDKLYYRSLTDDSVKLSRGDYEIRIDTDRVARTLTISDNGCGMTADELENNLGTIAKSGSYDFKNENEQKEDVDIIGQFGVGFYSAFMVSDKITVTTRAFGADAAWIWESEGVDGYTITEGEKASVGTEIVLHLRADTDEEKYSEYLDTWRIKNLVKKYSDYIRYPIRMDVTTEKLKEGVDPSSDAEDKYETVTTTETLNSMTPLWKKRAQEVTEEEYAAFYRDKFYDFEAPAKTIHFKSEGTATFDAMLFIPAKAPFNYYTKDYEKGLQLYSSGVLIMEKCADLLPDYFSFVRGLADSADLSLNISRELLQHDHQLKIIAKAIEKKIKNELARMLDSDREKYEAFWRAFGMQLKFGLYSDYGQHKDVLQDLVLFTSSAEKKLVTLKEYVSRMKEEQKSIYYACGETVDKIEMLPQCEAVTGKGYEVLYLTDDVDEFALKMLMNYDEKNFVNVCAEELDIATEEEKEAVKAENESSEDMLNAMKEALGDAVSAVRFTNALGSHPVCLTSEGGLSVGMEQVLNRMPSGEEAVKAQIVLEINASHAIADKLKSLYVYDRDKLSAYAKILYAQARLIGGMSIENPAELSTLVCDLMI
ncbi:MAG: molecular chaperone HtpG [Ruminococcaceae bacterium]|nr:molecular chaperone HtpG [Oscillospiraceae bacterium]